MTNSVISTLAQVKTWLQTLEVGTTTSVAKAQFDAELVAKVFALLGTDALALAVTRVDAAADSPQLVGTATVLGQANTTATFTFSQPTAKLLAELQLTLPGDVSWRLLDAFQLGFAGLEGTMTPNEELDVVGLEFDATLRPGGSSALALPVRFTVPSFEGDWTLSGSFDGLGNLTADLLQLLAGNSPIVSILPADLQSKLGAFKLKEYQMSFNPRKQTCSFIRVALRYDSNWSFFNNLFTIEGLEFDFEVFNPLAKQPTYQATLLADMRLTPSIPLEVGGQFPGTVLFFHLQPDKVAQLTDAFRFLQIPLPANFPDIELSTLGLVFYVEEKGYDFKLGVSKPIPLGGSVSLNNAFFEMGANFNASSGQMEGFGTIQAQFAINQTVITLSAHYNAGLGVALVGEVDNLPIGELLNDLAQRFQVTNVPAFLTGMVLQKLKVTYDTGTGDFSFDCRGTMPMGQNKVAIQVTLTAKKATTPTGFSQEIHATGILTYQQQTFRLDFDRTSTDTAFGATWLNGSKPLGIKDIAGLLGLADEVPDIPEGLDLGLQAAKFVYNTATDQSSFSLYASSATYGNAALVARKDKVTAKWLFYFGLTTGRRIDLSNLPILDKLTVIDQGVLAVEAIHVDVASAVFDKDMAKKLTDQLTKYQPADQRTYPAPPAAGMTSVVGFSMQVDIGGQKLPVALGAAGAAPPKQMAAGPELPLLALAHIDTLHPSEVAERYSVRQLALGDSGGKTVWFDLQKSFGPLYFDKIGLAYRDSKIFVLLNVSATAAGLTLSLDGFGIGMPIKSFEISFTISGIGLTFQNGPILVSGGLLGTFNPVNLVGQVVIKTPVLGLGALGGYTEVAGHPSLFLFAVLNYPIGGPPYFFVTGLAAGFGFNRSLVLPDISGVATFPFVQWAMGDGAPPSSLPGDNVGEQVNKALQTIVDKGVVAPTVGSNWLAAGLRFTTFEILDSFALLTVAFGTEFEVALLGLSRIILPPAANKAGGKAPIVVYAELALKASYSQKTGLIGIQGQLTNNSYVLSRDCHLTGGFAFFMWVSGDYAGDFVVTLGGYNTNFNKPQHYPAVPRLGINWQVTPQLSIKGGEYFALTSNAVMAGGYLEAVWQSGPIRAWFTLQADFLMMWKPFHYDITASVSLGASFSIDLWFTTLHLTVHVGASLHIWGPEFTGEATIDLDIISFTIAFGAGDRNRPQTIKWEDFARDMLPQKPQPKATREQRRLAALAGDSTPPPPNPDVTKLVVTGGLLKQLSDAEGELNWVVNSEQFTLTTQSVVPSKDWNLSANLTLDPTDAASQVANNVNFGIRPTGTAATTLKSTHRITITGNSTFYARKTLGKVAKGLWETIGFDRNGNPILGDPLNNTTLDGVLTGFSIVPHVAPPDHTLPISLDYLQFTIDPNLQYFSWSAPYVPSGSEFGNATVADTITQPRAVANRDLLVQAMQANGLGVDADVNVAPLADAATSYLLSEPVLCLLGEEK